MVSVYRTANIDDAPDRTLFDESYVGGMSIDDDMLFLDGVNANDTVLDVVWDQYHEDADTDLSPACERGLLLNIVVLSSPGNVIRRSAIRGTWGQDSFNGNPPRYRTFFLIGRGGLNGSILESVESESKIHGDILIGNYVDTYRNLSVKVLHGMSWVWRHCRPKYYLKTDDDCFVDPDVIAGDLALRDSTAWRKNHLYVGCKIENAEVHRNPTHRWYVSRQDYPHMRYPPYASGFGYLLSYHTLSDVVHKAAMRHPFPVEDAYLGVLASLVGVYPVDSSNFVNPSTTNSSLLAIEPCHRPYVVHGVDNPQNQYVYHQIAAESKKCKWRVFIQGKRQARVPQNLLRSRKANVRKMDAS
ncbi:beta-1,3-galactosyltransferase 5-like [Diadema antillarum]|uniref:beta-1,3-galactosyltransferase 5-like n=1 Tax=Diadema antillarum TaxID=105358 RepID=UPI003A83798E